MLRYLADINAKRADRAMIPLTAAGLTASADVISIGGSVLNVVGTATAGAMGGGAALIAAGYGASAVGGGVKVGAASLKPGAYVIRTGKQKLRDIAGSSSGPASKVLSKKLFGKRVFNTDKTTDQKYKYLKRSSNTLIRRIKEIPDEAVLRQMNPVDQHKHVNKIHEVETMLGATGVDIPKLAAAKSINEMKTQLRKAMRGRD